MRSSIRLLIFATFFSAAVFGTARFSGEKGARPHLVRLAAGQYHNCAVLDDGTVQCWGRNNYGQLGDGTLTTRLTPATVSNLGTTISITAGAFHTCALSSSGTVSCWGLNDNGRLGNGTAASSSVPVPVSGLTNVVSIAAGGAHTCAARVDGSVWCWGAAMANGSTVSTLAPVKVNLSGAVSVTAGGNHTCALMANTKIYCWGDNTQSQLGNFLSPSTNVPVPVIYHFYGHDIESTGFVDVSAGGRFTCARTAAGALGCWGDDTYGQVGDGAAGGARISPTYNQFSTSVAVSAGGAHTCATSADGTVFCFGLDDELQLGVTPNFSNYDPFARTVPTVGNAIEIAAGAKHSCAAIVDGTIRCWGGNAYGQLGNGTTGQVGIPTTVVGISGTFLGRGITAGNQFPCARRGSGTPACWGFGTQGQLGNSASVSSFNPVAVTGITNAIGLTAGSSHACAIDVASVARCWGDNSRGQLGNGTTTRSNQPVPVSGGDLYVAISAGDFHTCGITLNATVKCWGAADHGQLGTGGTADSLTPVAIQGDLQRAMAIAAGNRFTCALSDDDRLWCWGDNSTGQLGNGTIGAPVLTPTLGPDLKNTTGIAAGASHMCALSAFGSVLCWGANSRGQLGTNSTATAVFATNVQGMADAVSISAGAFFTCAAQAEGTASCWGANDSDELSAIDSLDHLTPTLVGNFRLCGFCVGGRVFAALAGVTAIAAGVNPAQPTQQHACALLATGVIDCWGNNAKGEIGDGTTTNAVHPTVVNSFAANVDPAAVLRNSRVAEVTALINCESGENAHIILTLAQGAASGTGHAGARCEDRLVRVPMTIAAQGPSGFEPGPATASVEAIGTRWTRQVVLSISK